VNFALQQEGSKILVEKEDNARDGEAPGDEEQDEGDQLQHQPLAWVDLDQAIADMVAPNPPASHPCIPEMGRSG